MIISGAFLLVCPVLTLAASARFSPHSLNALGSQAVNLWRLQVRTTVATESGLLNQDSDRPNVKVSDSEKQSLFTSQWFTQPLDHFSADSGHTFLQRFWVNARHYRPGVGGPVYVLDGGETSGENRLPFLDTGIMEILAKATGGVSVVLEHRYYGMHSLILPRSDPHFTNHPITQGSRFPSTTSPRTQCGMVVPQSYGVGPFFNCETVDG